MKNQLIVFLWIYEKYIKSQKCFFNTFVCRTLILNLINRGREWRCCSTFVRSAIRTEPQGFSVARRPRSMLSMTWHAGPKERKCRAMPALPVSSIIGQSGILGRWSVQASGGLQQNRLETRNSGFFDIPSIFYIIANDKLACLFQSRLLLEAPLFLKNTMKNPTNAPIWRIPAFTLVELIVVITIVWILSTVGFISYSGYLAGARDSNRYSQMTKLSDSLQVYAARKSLPLPDNYIEITASGTTIAYQGYVGTDVLETIDYTNGGKDPKDDSFFTYFLSRDRKSLQLLAFMEESVAFTPGITESYAADYSTRYPVTYGNKLWVLTDVNNTPVQEISSVIGSLDVFSTTLTLKSFLSDNEYVVDNLATLPQLQELVPQKGRFWREEENAFVYTGTEEVTDWSGWGGGSTPTPSNRYPGCDTDDITVWSYTLAACNVGATTASTDWTISRWEYFQWGRNKGFAFGDTTPLQTTQIAGSIGLNASTDMNGFVAYSSLPSPYSWANTDITNNWWHTTNSNIARQWPCAPWYRVPTPADWQDLVLAWWWGVNGAAMQTALQLPYAGYRNEYGSWNGGGSLGYYWFSTPYSDYARNLRFTSIDVNASSHSFSRAVGFPVRCFKN